MFDDGREEDLVKIPVIQDRFHWIQTIHLIQSILEPVIGSSDEGSITKNRPREYFCFSVGDKIRGGRGEGVGGDIIPEECGSGLCVS